MPCALVGIARAAVLDQGQHAFAQSGPGWQVWTLRFFYELAPAQKEKRSSPPSPELCLVFSWLADSSSERFLYSFLLWFPLFRNALLSIMFLWAGILRLRRRC